MITRVKVTIECLDSGKELGLYLSSPDFLDPISCTLIMKKVGDSVSMDIFEETNLIIKPEPIVINT